MSAVTLLGAVVGAFEPVVLLGLLAVGSAMILGSLLIGPLSAWQWNLAIRVVVATVGPFVLLLPWSLNLMAADGPVFGATGEHAGGELWRWLLLSPDLIGFPGILAGVGFLLAGLLGLMLGTARAPGFVTIMWTVALGGAVSGWWLGRTGEITWPGVPLLLTAAAFAGLFAMAFATAEASLSRFGFGWRQLAAVATAIGVAASLGVVAIDLAKGPWEAYAVDDPPLPAFIGAAAEQDPFRVLVLADTPEGIQWEVVHGTGPTMAAFGVPDSSAYDQVEEYVTDALDRRDPDALARLGPLNVRFVLVPSGGTSEGLDEVLRAQVGLISRPLAGARLFEVAGAMPPVSLLGSAEASAALEQRGFLPEGAQPLALRRDDDAVYRGRPRVDGTLVIADADSDEWMAEADGQQLERVDDDGVPVRFEATEQAGTVEVWHAGGPARRLAVTGQLLAVLFAISLALRPPSFARRPELAERSGLPVREVRS